MAIERFGKGKDFFYFEPVDEEAASNEEDSKLTAFRAAYLECAAKVPSPDTDERMLQQAWSQIGPHGATGMAGTRGEMELTAALLRGYGENTRGDSRMVSAYETTDVLDPEAVEIMRAIDDPAIRAFEKRLALGNTALGLAAEIESCLSSTPGEDGDALEAEFQALIDGHQAA